MVGCWHYADFSMRMSVGRKPFFAIPAGSKRGCRQGLPTYGVGSFALAQIIEQYAEFSARMSLAG
jgi:hypothetical protein